MKTELISCDCCGAAYAKSVSFYIDRRMDAAGSMEDLYESVDLCHDCTVKLIGFIQKHNMGIGNSCFAEVRRVAAVFTSKNRAKV
jgi:hypothetical protein